MFDVESVRDRLAQNPEDPMALSALTSWIGTNPAREDLLDAARRAAADYQIAKPVLDALLIRNPKDITAWELLGQAAFLSGLDAEADQAIQCVLRLDPTSEQGLDLLL